MNDRIDNNIDNNRETVENGRYRYRPRHEADERGKVTADRYISGGNPKIDNDRRKPLRGRRLGIIACMLVMLLLGFIGGRFSAAFGGAGRNGFNNQAMLGKMKRLEAYINAFYLNDVDTEAVANGVYQGLLSGLGDPYSVYYTEEEYKELLESDSGEYEGIGIIVYKDTTSGYVIIDQVMKDQPAYNAGVESGDIIVSVDGTDTSEITLTETVNKIKRSESETVKLVLLRDSQTIEKEITKSHIEMETVSYEMKEGGIGYISVSQFIENTDEHFIKAVDDLEKQGMKGLVIDLRDNGGGLLDTCVNMVSRIIPEDDLIVYTEDKNGKKDEYKSNSSKVLDVPIVILANENTASASEIMTGCLKDYDMATVIGGKTFGKGIVQNIMPLGDGSAIKLTVSKYYTPKGNNIHEVGIEPDVNMEYTKEEWAGAKKDPEKDTQLKKALSILKEEQ